MDGGPTRPAFLGVERSLRGKRWRLREADDRIALALAQRHDLPELAGRVLAARGIGLDEAPHFLNPTLRHLMPDPSRLRDMDAAAARLERAIVDGERIAVFGDYDVDGATSTALLGRFLNAVGAPPPRLYVPDRLTEGYGPNGPALRRLAADGVRLTVTVDCGATAHDALAAAAEAGLDVVVLDHHEADSRLPPAIAVVNPNRLDEDRGLGHLAAVGVTFLCVVAVNRRLRAAGWFTGERREPDLMRLLDLVALGTVCDVVPLVGLNRALVAQGLKVMARRTNPGLAALADVAGVREPPGTYHAGFLLGPRVNAGGRVGESDLGARLLACDDPDEAAELARRLDACNGERQALEARVLEQAIDVVESDSERCLRPALVAAVGDGWHPGVVGIVASRLAERYNRPACVLARDGATAVGSGRSLPGLDLGAAVIAAHQSDLLIKGGGHAMAAGFTVAAQRIDEFLDFLAGRLEHGLPDAGLVPDLSVDGALKAAAAHAATLAAVQRAAPFGAGNAEPRFVLTGVRVTSSAVVGEAHVRCALAGAAEGGRVQGIAFRSVDDALGQTLLNHRGAVLHVAGRLRRDRWRNGDAVQFQIDDAAPAG